MSTLLNSATSSAQERMVADIMCLDLLVQAASRERVLLKPVTTGASLSLYLSFWILPLVA